MDLCYSRHPWVEMWAKGQKTPVQFPVKSSLFISHKMHIKKIEIKTSCLKHSIVNRGLKRRAVASTTFCSSCIQFKVYFIPGTQNGVWSATRSPHTSAQDRADIRQVFLWTGYPQAWAGFGHWWAHADLHVGHWKLDVCVYTPVLSATLYKSISTSFLFMSFPPPTPHLQVSLCVSTFSPFQSVWIISLIYCVSASSTQFGASYCSWDEGKNPVYGPNP